MTARLRAQQQGDKHSRVQENQTAIGELTKGQVQNDQNDNANRRGAGDRVDLFQPDAVPPEVVDFRKLKRTEKEKDQRQAKRYIRDQSRLVCRIDRTEPLHPIAQPVSQYKGDSDQEQITDAQKRRPPVRWNTIEQGNQPIPVRSACGPPARSIADL